MQELSKPTNKNFWIVRTNDGSVLHLGETNPDQVTSTGLDVLEYSPFEGIILMKASEFASQFPPLPSLGELCEQGQVYDSSGQAVKCVQTHNRTADPVENIPALFTVESQQGAEWVQPTGAQDAYQTDDIVEYSTEYWISKIDANTTVPDGDEPFNRYWEPYTWT